jgi:hypothetical protein
MNAHLAELEEREKAAAIVESPSSPILYFIHIPKTAGITLKTWFENNLPLGTSFVIDEWEAAATGSEELGRYRFFSGHYSSDVLMRLERRPDFLMTVIRDPLSRFMSWSAHCRRVSDPKYRNLFEGRSDLDVIRGPGGYTCRQAHWLLRALSGGQSCTRVPAREELPDLLSQVGLVGLTDELDRFMQLVSFLLGWPPPPAGWRINRTPEAREVAPEVRAEIAGELAIDFELYRLAGERFRQSYGSMVAKLDPSFNPVLAAPELPPFDRVQKLLQMLHLQRLEAAEVCAARGASLDFAEPLDGRGWWWRECPHSYAYRWSGPETTSEINLPPLEKGRHYRLTLEVFGAADWTTWEQLTLTLNEARLFVVRESVCPVEPHSPQLRLVSHIDPESAAQTRPYTRIALHVPETVPALQHVLRKESLNTFNYDQRRVGLAVHRLDIVETSAPCVPRPWTRRF